VVVCLFGAWVDGNSFLSGTSGDLILAGTEFNGTLTLTGNKSAAVTIPSGETRNYGVGVVGNYVNGKLTCTGNDPGATNFGAPNRVNGQRFGQCRQL
jgi:hypothetical protein